MNNIEQVPFFGAGMNMFGRSSNYSGMNDASLAQL